jgi:1,4-alpha-glucan branching enzyme
MILFLYFYEKISLFTLQMNTENFYISDPWLKPFTALIDKRISKCLKKEADLTGERSLTDFAMGHYYYGLHQNSDGWVMREWAPNATKIFVTGVFSEWKEDQRFMMTRTNPGGDWELKLPMNELKHGDLYKLSVHWEGGMG